ncbi:MAG TPA: hypothetical protein VFR04_07820 [Solirubrobacterales bacterium]|nr:hypothetical protein [Solirubrobacterales bacterium]
MAIARALPGLSVVLVFLALVPAAAAAPAVSLRATLEPKRLGADTTVSLGFRVAPGPNGELPALSNFALRLPPWMGFAASTLGLSTCSPSTLLLLGAGGCPHESLIGFGSARVQVPFASQVVQETGRVSMFMAKPVDQHTTTLFYFDGRRPVIAPLVLQGELVTPQDSLDSVLTTPIPAIPTASDGPEGAMVAMRVSIGPRRLRYFKRVDGHTVAYRPKGFSIPTTCPPGGFEFVAKLRFRDGTRAGARTAVPCPPPREHGRGRGERR